MDSNSRLRRALMPEFLFLCLRLFWQKITWLGKFFLSISVRAHSADTLLNLNSADVLSSAKQTVGSFSFLQQKQTFCTFSLWAIFFFPALEVCEVFPAGKCTLQAARPSVQRERSLSTSYDTNIWHIDLTSLSPPLLDNALVPRVKSLLSAGTLQMWLASALQSTLRELSFAQFERSKIFSSGLPSIMPWTSSIWEASPGCRKL